MSRGQKENVPDIGERGSEVGGVDEDDIGALEERENDASTRESQLVLYFAGTLYETFS